MGCGSQPVTNEPATMTPVTDKPGCDATESCGDSCENDPTTCEEFEAMIADGGCAATCCESITKTYKDALGGCDQPGTATVDPATTQAGEDPVTREPATQEPAATK